MNQDTKHEETKREEPKDLQQANENIRKAEGDESLSEADPQKTGNKPALDRDR